MKKRKTIIRLMQYLGLCVIGFILLFPITWMVLGTFKDNTELFGSLKLIPEKVDFPDLEFL